MWCIKENTLGSIASLRKDAMRKMVARGGGGGLTCVRLGFNGKRRIPYWRCSEENDILPTEKESERRRLPIFPLSIVALPFSQVPLHIFEARYRVLFSTLLAGEDGIEDDLANSESEFYGTKEFGMCFIDKQGNIAAVGSLLHIEQHNLLEDGRLYIENTAVKRFKVTEVIEQRPVLLCEVEFLEETGSNDDMQIQELADEVKDIFMKALSLGSTLEGAEKPEKPEQLSLEPTQLSFWLASLFPQDPQEQQQLLQMNGTKDRLEREKDIFTATYNYHLARSSIKSAFQ